ncbi:protein E6-like [Prosopis cineraria]|uniref:protein E6-like n=1 Tax=Prosopis cineraria TaxID=364024 RepID=UPI0024105873|nr:protein E6-like [Prosopis cineraria]
MSTMASSFSNCISLLLLTSIFMSLQIHARDSQFFSKVTHVTIPTTTNKGVKETELPKKEEPVNKPEQEPSFMPETESSYGLYGHESGQFAPTTTTTTTTTYKPYKTEFEQHTDKYPNKYYYNNDAYNTNQKQFTNTKLTGTGYSNNNYYNYKTDAYGGNQNEFSSMENQNNQKYYHNNAANDRYFDNNNNAVNDKYFHNNYAAKNNYYSNNNAANNRYNSEKQGMSDTRFMEGGKYFYDINAEKYDPALYGDSSRGVNARSWENNRGYFGNNNAKSYENTNSFEAYQNQEEFENEPEDFEP